MQHTVSKNNIYIFLPYLGKLPLSARSTLEKTIRDILPCVNLNAVFRIRNTLSSKFTFKGKISKACVPYFVTSFSVVAAMLLIMVKPNIALSTGKNIKSNKNSAVRDHMLVCNNNVSFEDFSVLANGTTEFRIKLQESLLIHRDGPHLNKTSESAPLMLFSKDIPYL